MRAAPRADRRPLGARRPEEPGRRAAGGDRPPRDAEDDAPVIRFINALLTQALRERASDIHIEAFEGRSLVRFRIDGTLRDVLEPPRALHAALVSRVKVMASLDIAEKRLPQDGRITLRIAGRPVDVRVSTLPTGHGERVVLRLLDKQQGRLDLGSPRHERRHRARRWTSWCARRTASCSSPGRPARARRRRCTRRCRGSMPATPQHHDRRGPDRVRPRRHRPDPGQPGDRA